MDKPHRLAAHLFPSLKAVAHGGDRRQRLHLQVDVDLAPAEVVNNHHLMARICQVHRAGPTAEAVATENEDLHCNAHSENPRPLQDERMLRFASYYRRSASAPYPANLG